MNNNELLLLKLGEVVLKGLNRRSFEDKLVNNVLRRMKHCCGRMRTAARQPTMRCCAPPRFTLSARGIYWRSRLRIRPPES